MAKAPTGNGITKSWTLTYTLKGETPGTWKYVRDGADDKSKRASGADTLYLVKADYPNKPGEKVTAVFTIS
jgi:hypothetical protein